MPTLVVGGLGPQGAIGSPVDGVPVVASRLTQIELRNDPRRGSRIRQIGGRVPRRAHGRDEFAVAGLVVRCRERGDPEHDLAHGRGRIPGSVLILAHVGAQRPLGCRSSSSLA